MKKLLLAATLTLAACTHLHAAQFIDMDQEGTKYHVLKVTKSDKLPGRFVWYDMVFKNTREVSGVPMTAIVFKAYYTCKDDFVILRFSPYNGKEKIFSYRVPQSKLEWARIGQNELIIGRQIQEYVCSDDAWELE